MNKNEELTQFSKGDINTVVNQDIQDQDEKRKEIHAELNLNTSPIDHGCYNSVWYIYILFNVLIVIIVVASCKLIINYCFYKLFVVYLSLIITKNEKNTIP